MDTQLDLFGEVEAAEEAVAAKLTEREEWTARFERADWIAPYDCGYGPAGTRVPGWRCPDPACGEVEPNDYTLSINHGFDPTTPGRAPWNGRCLHFRSQQWCTHKLHNVHPSTDGTLTGDCTCRNLDGITGTTEAELEQLVDQHREAVTAELAPVDGWDR
jgi:hypothetical protein